MVQNKVKDTRRPGAPGWKGPSVVPKQRARHINPNSKEGKALAAANAVHWSLPHELQQLVLNIYRDSYLEVLASDDLVPTLQEIKTALFERDFARAFGNEKYLEAYTARWSPSRALCYGSALVDLRNHMEAFSVFAQSDKSFREQQKANAEAEAGIEPESVDSCQVPATRVVCIGGGAAEVVAFGGALRYMLSSSGAAATEARADQAEVLDEDADEQEVMDALAAQTARMALPSETPLLLDMHLIDSADWSPVTSKLTEAMTTLPPLSKYASKAARAMNNPLLPKSSLRVQFHHNDILTMSVLELKAVLGDRPVIVTLFFTLNELYTSSIAKTTALLLKLTTLLCPGSILLVIDSPGSYSEASVGSAKENSEAKKYPMSWLLDHALLPKQLTKKEKDEARKAGIEIAASEWEKVEEDEARWFRLREGLQYPISLENMRFQLHIFKKI